MMKYIKIISGIACLIVIFGLLEYKGIIWHNSVFANKYKVKGIDVSHYQGEIDWSKVTTSYNFQFAYIKATEGRDYTDEFFNDNWVNAKANNLLVGAYHFFTTQSTGEQQAEHFINVVPNEEGLLPPVIDIEIDMNKNIETIEQELTTLSNQLEQHYKKRPILYVTYATFNRYISSRFEDHEIWIRDIVKYPTIKGKREWTFWQYNNRGRVKGIDAYVDINVFNGKREEFNNKFKG
jgi:lysozyme